MFVRYPSVFLGCWAVFFGEVHGISIASLCIVLLDIFLMHIFVSSGVRLEMNEDKLEPLYSVYI